MKNLLMCATVVAMMMCTGINAQITEKENTAEVQGEFQKIRLTELPAAVTEAVKADYEKANIGEAYMDGQGRYKLLLEANGAERTVYANAQGEWIQPKK